MNTLEAVRILMLSPIYFQLNTKKRLEVVKHYLKTHREVVNRRD